MLFIILTNLHNLSSYSCVWPNTHVDVISLDKRTFNFCNTSGLLVLQLINCSRNSSRNSYLDNMQYLNHFITEAYDQQALKKIIISDASLIYRNSKSLIIVSASTNLFILLFNGYHTGGYRTFDQRKPLVEYDCK
jgi:hypothetical protein